MPWWTDVVGFVCSATVVNGCNSCTDSIFGSRTASYEPGKASMLSAVAVVTATRDGRCTAYPWECRSPDRQVRRQARSEDPINRIGRCADQEIGGPRRSTILFNPRSRCTSFAQSASATTRPVNSSEIPTCRSADQEIGSPRDAAILSNTSSPQTVFTGRFVALLHGRFHTPTDHVRYPPHLVHERIVIGPTTSLMIVRPLTSKEQNAKVVG